MTMTEQERIEFLNALGLDETAKPEPKATPVQSDDPHTMLVTEIVFDERDVDGFDLETQFSEASRVLFAKYRSKGRNEERHGLLHRRITEFLGKVRKGRRPEGEGYVKEQIAVAKLIRESGLTIENLLAAMNGEGK